MAVASLVLGILSLVFAFLPFIPFGGFICSILGLIFAIVAKRNVQSGNTGMATGGLVCSIIGLILSVITYIACGAALGALGCAGKQILNELGSMQP